MDQYLLFAILGLGAGAVYSSLAIGLVATYRGSGVVNFAIGANALYGAYTYSYLRSGDIFVPVPGLADRVSVTDSLPTVVALPVALCLAGLLGLAMFLVVFRALRHAPQMARAAASIGLAILFQATFAMQAGTNAILVPPIFPQDTIEFAGSNVPVDRIWLAISIAVTSVLAIALYRFTSFGHATEAVAESPTGAVLTGLSPDLVGGANWVLSSVVAAFGGIMISPIVPLVPLSYAGFLVAGLAAALVARFRSVGVALLVGLLIGIAQSVLTLLSTRHDWLPQTGMNDLVPLVVVLAVLLARGTSLPGKADASSTHIGLALSPSHPWRSAAVAAPVAGLALALLDGGYRTGLLISVVFAIVALSFTVITGYAGQASLAQLSLAGAGAFATSKMSTDWGIPFPLTPILAASVAAVIGTVIGLPALRLRGLHVAVATLALAAALEGLWFRNPDFNGGLSGAPVHPPEIFGIDLSVGVGRDFPRLEYCLFCLGVLTVVALGVSWLRRSRMGTAMLAVRANERSAASAGVDVARTKVIAFAIASFIAGLGGSLLAYARTSVAADSYSTFVGLVLLATVFVAGVNLVSGALVAGALASGGLLFVIVERNLELGSWYSVLAGAALVASVVREPEGIAGTASRLISRSRDAAAPRQEGTVRADGTGGFAPRPAPTSSPVLSGRGLTVSYGGVLAVEDADLDVHAGRVVGLVGPNGAGKSSLLDALSGLTPASGRILLCGNDVSGLAPHRRAHEGLARSFQSQALYDDLTVHENVRAGLLFRSGSLTVDDAEAVGGILATMGLEPVAHTRAGDLSQGQRQLVSVARTAVGAPSAVLLDEPAAGLDAPESRWLGTRIRALSEQGVAVLLVEHDMSLVQDVCDVVYVLHLGRVIASGDPTSVYADEAVTTAYLGVGAARQRVGS